MELDFFIHYHSKSPYLMNGAVSVHLPGEKPLSCWISLANIALTFPNGHVPSSVVGYLALAGTESTQAGNRCLNNGASTRGKLLFPLANPATRYPSSPVYQQVSLQPKDSFKLTYLGEDLLEVPGVEISVTVHLAGTADAARATI